MVAHSLGEYPDCPRILPGSREEQIFIGSLLGDGTISPKGQFIENHSYEQKELVELLAKLFEPLFLFQEQVHKTHIIRIKEYKSRYHQRKNVDKLFFRVTLPQIPSIKAARREWYPAGNKCIPDNILDKIGPQALAWWYLCDGTFPQTSNHIKFSTTGFTEKDNQKLCKVLSRLGYESAKVTSSNRIRLNSSDSVQLLKHISKYVPPTMRYKLKPEGKNYQGYDPTLYSPTT